MRLRATQLWAIPRNHQRGWDGCAKPGRFECDFGHLRYDIVQLLGHGLYTIELL